MALTAGTLALTVEYGQGLKDQDWFGKQDPYVVVTCGGQTFRSRTAIDGGRNPVWNQTFTFNIINENSASIRIYDEDTLSRDDLIGECQVSFALARERGADQRQIPVVSSKSRRQHGIVSVRLQFTPNASLRPGTGAYAPAPYAAAPAPYYGGAAYPQQQPAYYAPPQAIPGYGAYGGPPAPQPAYAAPYHAPAAPPAYAAPYQPPAYAAPAPQPAYAPYPQQPAYAALQPYGGYGQPAAQAPPPVQQYPPPTGWLSAQ